MVTVVMTNSECGLVVLYGPYEKFDRGVVYADHLHHQHRLQGANTKGSVN